jgi:hypothetical protein
MTDLVEFVRACLDDDERVAQAVDPRGWIEATEEGHWNEFNQTEIDHIARHDPARVLAEVAAKRAILDLHAITVTKVATAPFDPDTGEPREPEYEVECAVCGWVNDDPTSGCETLRLLAQPFAGRPGWREEWAT